MASLTGRDQYSIPSGFPEILKDLSREVIRAQPNDVVEFCAKYFDVKSGRKPASPDTRDANSTVPATPATPATGTESQAPSVPPSQGTN